METEVFLRAQEVQEVNRQLRIANAELDAFSYSVSHDLRAPLRSIDGFSQILLEDYLDKLDAEGQQYLRKVRESSQQMAQLIDDLLNLSRVTRADMKMEAVDLSAMARTVAQELQTTEPERAAEFEIQPGMTAQGDPRLLRVVLNNLLGNAWKYSGTRPHTRIEVGQREQNGQVPYFVRDNGVGFDMAYADKLFGVFQRLHSGSEFPGTGIGLATVQRIIHRHGGRIWADGAVGQGATFYFTF
jgi:light-regulated signal transduction histidine kinase (bacteriophytochrome)